MTASDGVTTEAGRALRRWVLNEVGASNEGAWSDELDRRIAAELAKAVENERRRLYEAVKAAIDGIPTHRQRIELGEDGKPSHVGRRIARRPEFVLDDAREAVLALLAPPAEKEQS